MCECHHLSSLDLKLQMVLSCRKEKVTLLNPWTNDLSFRSCCYFQFAGKFDVVVNCTGLGSRELCKDDKIEPARGHILR
ncbi:Hypothetical predicted protein, partial [Paramuricea clavata]